MGSNNVMVFTRAGDTPMITRDGQDIRLCYNDQWVDFRDGKVVVTGEDGQAVIGECQKYKRQLKKFVDDGQGSILLLMEAQELLSREG